LILDAYVGNAPLTPRRRSIAVAASTEKSIEAILAAL
jgi:hypothetical protein